VRAGAVRPKRYRAATRMGPFTCSGGIMATDAMTGLARYLADQFAFYQWVGTAEIWLKSEPTFSYKPLSCLSAKEQGFYPRVIWRALATQQDCVVMWPPPYGGAAEYAVVARPCEPTTVLLYSRRLAGGEDQLYYSVVVTGAS